MKRITVATLLVTLLVGLLSAQALASPPVQSTHTVTLASSQEVAVGYNRDLDEKVAYDSSEDALRFGNYVAPQPRPGRSYFRTYMHFGLGRLPAGATIQRATLSVHVYDRRFPGGGGLNAGVYRVTQGGWTEPGLKNTGSWSWDTLPGFQSAPEAVVAVSGTGQWYSWDVTSLVQAWYGGGTANDGLMLSGSPESGVAQAVGARSRAGAVPDQGPRLEVTYVGGAAAAATPSPPQIEPAISKHASPTEVLPGDEVTFSIQSTNHGRDAAVEVVIIDVVSEHLEILEATTTQGTVTVEGQKVIAQVGVIGQNFVVEVSIRSRVKEDVPVPSEIENVAMLKSPNGGERTSQPVIISVGAGSPGADVTLPETGATKIPWTAVALPGAMIAIMGWDMLVLCTKARKRGQTVE